MPADSAPSPSSRAPTVSLALVVLLACTVSVLGAEFVLNLAGPNIKWRLFPLNVLLLAGTAWLAIAVLRRPLPVLAGVLSLFWGLELVNRLKIRTLQSPIHPMDVHYLGELWTLDGLSSTAVSALLLSVCVTLVAASVVWVGRRITVRPASATVRNAGVGVALVLLLGMAVTPHLDATAPWISSLGINWTHWHPGKAAREHGLLLDFWTHLGDAYAGSPSRYSREAVQGALARIDAVPAAPAKNLRPNVILYLVESMMDPDILNMEFTEDPTPTLHRLLRAGGGKVVCPGFGGYSANTEFELLTGMAMYFLPRNSCPHNQFVRRDLPAWPRAMRDQGYETIGIQVGSLAFYNYKSVYPHLGFQRLISLAEDPSVALAPGERFATDSALVDRIIRETAGDTPYFLFAFTMTTHWPYTYPDYLKSSLDIRNNRLSQSAHDELKTYLNALHAADAALGKLVEHVAADPRPTILIALGDHLPPLSEEVYAAAGLPADGDAAVQKTRRQTPVAVFANYPVQMPTIDTSTNFLASQIMTCAGLELSNYFRLNEELGDKLRVLSPLIQQPTSTDETAQKELLRAYNLLQYDTLLGERYASDFLSAKRVDPHHGQR